MSLSLYDRLLHPDQDIRHAAIAELATHPERDKLLTRLVARLGDSSPLDPNTRFSNYLDDLDDEKAHMTINEAVTEALQTGFQIEAITPHLITYIQQYPARGCAALKLLVQSTHLPDFGDTLLKFLCNQRVRACPEAITLLQRHTDLPSLTPYRAALKQHYYDALYLNSTYAYQLWTFITQRYPDFELVDQEMIDKLLQAIHAYPRHLRYESIRLLSEYGNRASIGILIRHYRDVRGYPKTWGSNHSPSPPKDYLSEVLQVIRKHGTQWDVLLATHPPMIRYCLVTLGNLLIGIFAALILLITLPIVVYSVVRKRFQR